MEGESPASENLSVLAQADDVTWIFFCLVLVILMQAGFACYEVGAIRAISSTQPILLKNIGDASISLIAWYVLGHGIAYGEDVGHAFGTPTFFSKGKPVSPSSGQRPAVSFLEFLFAWSFAATCTTIVSGAVADRISFKTYIVYSILTSAVFYPFLAHMVWADQGWASSTKPSPFFDCGVIDFAGSGVVHMFGGGMSLSIAKLVKTRKARFFEPNYWDGGPHGDTKLKNHTDRPQLNENDFRQNDPAWTTLGCFLLWLGWYGFNCGSTLAISTIEAQNTVGLSAMNTTIGAACGCIFSMLIELGYHRFSPEYRRNDPIEDPLHRIAFDVDAPGTPSDRAARQRRAKEILGEDGVDMIARHRANHKGWTWPYSTHKNLHGAAVNGILAGLVGITAGCATMNYPWAILVSLVSALLYHVSYRGFICCKIDDAIGAGAIHLVCGAWGLIAAGFTAMDEARVDAGYPASDVCSKGSQFVANLVMVPFVAAYAIICTVVFVGVLLPLCLVELHRGEGLRFETGVILRGDPDNLAELRSDVNRQFRAENRQINEVVTNLKRLEERTQGKIRELTNQSSQRLRAIEALKTRVADLENAGTSPRLPLALSVSSAEPEEPAAPSSTVTTGEPRRAPRPSSPPSIFGGCSVA
eukprot:g10899.t1